MKLETKPLLIAFSGGRTSAYMTKLLIDKYQGKREIAVVFANTGVEREETLEFVNNCDLNFGFNTVWIETIPNPKFGKGCSFEIVDYGSASRDGLPFERVISKYGIPNKGAQHCSRELKHYPIKKYINSLGWKDYDIALGIRADEPKRLTPKDRVVYPLFKEFPTTKLMVNRWWAAQPFNLMLKDYEGNCTLCWKKSKRKLLTIIIEHPEFLEWWNEMELKYGYYVPESHKHNKKLIVPAHFFRGDESAQDLLEESTFPFTKQEDAFTISQLMFSEPELDFTDGCEESCEAF